MPQAADYHMSRRAFTLVELLVVIAIIGLLSTVAVISLSSARSKARDTKRQADIKQIITAMQLYYQDNGGYPNPGGMGCPGAVGTGYCLGHGSSGTCWSGATTYGCTALDNALAPYIAKIPDDPDPGNTGYNGDAYIYGYNSATYGTYLHWGEEQTTNANNCYGGLFGAWSSGYKGNHYWCILTLTP
jgi:prepilin-type N-terminal cleavage/methylation domain-containing protein